MTSRTQDVLLFIDNIFRFVPGRLGGVDAARAYAVGGGLSAHLADEMGQLQERITSTRGHSITSLQAIYVPADDLTDPAPARPFAHLDATTVLSRADFGVWVSTRLWTRSTRPRGSSILATSVTSTTRSPARVKEVLQRYKDLQDIIAILGIDELSEEDKVTVGRARRKSSASSRRTCSWRRPSPASRARSCRLRRPFASFKKPGRR